MLPCARPPITLNSNRSLLFTNRISFATRDPDQQTKPNKNQAPSARGLLFVYTDK